MFAGFKNGPRKPADYARARELRQAGRPIKRIASSLGVSPSTVHRWTADIELSPEQTAAIERESAARWKEVVAARAESWSARNRDLRLGYQAEGRARARERDPLHLGGCMLYWAEGNKARNVLRLVNSDLPMLMYFRRFLAECFELGPDRFVVSLNVYLGNGLSIAEIEDHWLEALVLPEDCLRKHQINHMPTSSSGRKTDKLPYGCCTLGVRESTHILQHIYGAIQEYGGFDEPRWLDGLY